MAGVGFTALVPARLASTRLPNKPLADIAGVPMVVRVVGQAHRSGAKRVVVATDAAAIADVVRAAGYEAVLTRADHPTGTDRLAEAAAVLGLAGDEIVVNVQGDEPLIPPVLIAAVARALAADRECAIATAAHPIEHVDEWLDPNVVKVVTDALGRAAYFSRAPIPFAREALAGFPARLPERLPPELLAAGLPLRHIGLYAYRASYLAIFPQLSRSPLESLESLEQLRASWHGHRIAVFVTPVAPPPGVDTPADLQRVRERLAASTSATADGGRQA